MINRLDSGLRLSACPPEIDGTIFVPHFVVVQLVLAGPQRNNARCGIYIYIQIYIYIFFIYIYIYIYIYLCIYIYIGFFVFVYLINLLLSVVKYKFLAIILYRCI